MTAPKPAPDLARGMRYALDLADKEDERIAKLSDEDFAKEMASLPPPSRVPDFDELLSGVKKKAAERQAPAKVAPLGDRAGRRAPWVAWLVAAAVAAVALTLFVERRELAAWLHPAPPIGPAPDQIKEPTPAEKAEALRVDADKACAGDLWGLCARKLDEAAKLNPAGDTTPRVASLRAALAAHGPTNNKPKIDEKVGPGK